MVQKTHKHNGGLLCFPAGSPCFLSVHPSGMIKFAHYTSAVTLIIIHSVPGIRYH